MTSSSSKLSGLDLSTLPPSTASSTGSSMAEQDGFALSLVWARDVPERIGETMHVWPDGRGPWTFGRGDAGGDPRRLVPSRARGSSPSPLSCRRLSRRQLLVTAVRSGLLVENVGGCPLLHRGREVTRVEIALGEIITLQNELMLLCVAVRGSGPFDVDPQPAILAHPFGEPDAFGLVGESQAMTDLRRRIIGIARQPFHVLVVGPSGTGKELVAQAIHAQSARAHKPIVARNAATIPEGLAAAELFGNLRNYPNPGVADRPGLVGEADGSTLFLDELAELPIAVQAHLLRVMDHGEYQRLGEAVARKTDLRVLAATNRPVSDIKHDLLARLKIHLEVPGLGQRREDIPLLVMHLLRSHAATDSRIRDRFFEGNVPRVSPGLMEALVLHPYTTHVRELDALLVRATLEGRGRYVELGREVTAAMRRSAMGETPPVAKEPPSGNGLGLSPLEAERLALMRKHGFSPTACGRDAAYRGNRQNADLHLRQLLCRALTVAAWDTERAVDLLAGGAASYTRERCAARLTTFLGKLAPRVHREDPAALRAALIEEWKHGADGVLRVVEAIRDGRLAVKLSPGADLA